MQPVIRSSLILCLSALPSSCAGEPPADAELGSLGEEGLTRGSGVEDGQEPAVGIMNGFAAALIGPHTVVTACHVVRKLTADKLAWRPSVAGARTYKVVRITCHNKGNDVNAVALYDIATLELAESVTEAKPLGLTSKLPPNRATGVAVWGTGCKRRDSQSPPPAERKRQRFSFDSPSGSQFLLSPDTGNFFGIRSPDGTRSALICAGDSGGPYVWNGDVFAVVHDWHASDQYDTFARVQPGW